MGSAVTRSPKLPHTSQYASGNGPDSSDKFSIFRFPQSSQMRSGPAKVVGRQKNNELNVLRLSHYINRLSNIRMDRYHMYIPLQPTTTWINKQLGLLEQFGEQSLLKYQLMRIEISQWNEPMLRHDDHFAQVISPLESRMTMNNSQSKFVKCYNQIPAGLPNR